MVSIIFLFLFIFLIIIGILVCLFILFIIIIIIIDTLVLVNYSIEVIILYVGFILFSRIFLKDPISFLQDSTLAFTHMKPLTL